MNVKTSNIAQSLASSKLISVALSHLLSHDICTKCVQTLRHLGIFTFRGRYHTVNSFCHVGVSPTLKVSLSAVDIPAHPLEATGMNEHTGTSGHNSRAIVERKCYRRDLLANSRILINLK